MAADFADQYYTEAGRLESFQRAQPLPKRRGSNTTGRAPKSMKWPHSWLAPEELAEAGFFYHPTQESPDNVMCFLCRESICGWEDGDNPFAEHLKLSPDCGWAITSCIEAKIGDLHLENPMSTRMVEARKATFGDRWPHEGKKGWKCQTKQLVEAGWIHKPTPEFDDFAECVYCTLALDGWEPADKPFHEHHARSQDCAFFALCNQPESPIAKKTAKGRKPRVSKASRLSTQSAFTEAPSIVDNEIEEGDSLMTTTSQATLMMAKGKKAATKGRKRKDEPVEVTAIPEPEEEVVQASTVAESKPRRGKKRASDQMGNAENVTEVQARPAKRRTRNSVAVPEVIMPDLSMEEPAIVDAPLPKPAAVKKTRGRPSKATRNTSTASHASLRAHIQDDDEVDKMLEADLLRQLDEMEDPMETRPAIEEEIPTTKASAAPTRKATRTSKITRAAHAMFSAAEMDADEVALEAELEAMEIEESRPLPKTRGAKAGQTRKVSAKQQTAAKRAAEAEAAAEAAAAEAAAAAELETAEAELAQAEAEAEARRIEAELAQAAEAYRIETEHEEAIQQSMKATKAKAGRTAKAKASQPLPTRRTRGSMMSANESILAAVSHQEDHVVDKDHDSGNETDASQSTVIRRNKRGSAITKGAKGGKKAASRNIEEIIHHKPESSAPHFEELAQPQRQRTNVSKKVAHIETILSPPPAPAPAPKPAKGRPLKEKGKAVADPVAESPVPEVLPVAPTPPPAVPSSPVLAPRDRTLTPSPSPQSSDAENRPPTSRATGSATVEQSGTSRIPLAATPSRSPSKRNIIAGLQSSHPWTGVDLDEVFSHLKSPEKENAAGGVFSPLASAIEKARKGELTVQEREMTVQEWVEHNASVAEERLKLDCERMVGVFEREGGRAMRALQGVDVLE